MPHEIRGVSEITGYACPPRCDAGGPAEDGGHNFTGWVTLEWHEPSISHITGKMMPRRPAMQSTVCTKCGLSAVDWTLLRGDE